MHLAKDKNGQNVLMYSNGSESKMSTKESIEEDQEAITTYLVNSKRHQIKINPKFATDNTKTNLKSNSADYLKYLIDNGILTTNAVVNEPTFQGYTNIYLNTGITVNNQPKSEIEAKKADIEIRRKDELTIWGQTEQDESTTGQEMDYQKATINAKYDAELKALEEQPKVSESGVEVTADDMGLAGAFDVAEMGGDVLDILKEFETEPKVENKSENIRNVQENFLSLSEIKGTVENTQLNETQAEVFNENKIPPTATEMRLINKAITVYQEDASKLTESQKKRLEEYAANYPESWKKICK